VLEQAAVLCAGGTVEPGDLRLGAVPAGSPEGDASSPGTTFAEAKRRHMEAFERRFLAESLRQHAGNISRTAAAIGMVRQSLQQKLKELGIKADDLDGEA
jgi:arginine utilization regulatory protein